MSRDADHLVVAGVDGTEDGIAAAEYAADLATERGLTLMLVHAYRRSPAINPLLPIGDPITSRGATTAVAYQPYAARYNAELMRDAGSAALSAARTHIEQRFPHLRVRERLAAGSAARTLVKCSKSAEVVVVARNHERSLERFFAGSTSSAVAAHARCPVVVVPTNWSLLAPADRIVVGLDAARNEAAVLEYAFKEASRRSSALIALHAWQSPLTWLDRQGLSVTGPDQSGSEQRLLSEALAGWSQSYPDVICHPLLISGSPAKALIEASDSADLVVIGSRGQGGLRPLMLGSTARAVVAHSTCAAVVVRHATGPGIADTRTELADAYPTTAFY